MAVERARPQRAPAPAMSDGRNSELDEAVARSWRRLSELRAQSAGTHSLPIADAAIEELSTALEELRVTGEKLRAQNIELTGALEELAVEKRRFRDLFERAPDAYVVTDEMGLIIDANSAAARLFAVTVARLRGKPLEVFVRGAVQRIIELPKRNGSTEAPAEWETLVRRRRTDDVSVGVTLVRVPSDGVVRIRWLLRDLTERKQAEQQAQAVLRAEITERERLEADRNELRRQLGSAEEDERRRIARELHDQMGQLVTALQLGLRALQRARSETDRQANMAELQALADQIARDVQHIALELRPPALDRLGVRLALEGHLQEWSERHSIATDFHCFGLDSERLPADVETTLFRVVQEGLTNVLKHADATQVSVVLERRSGYVRVIIEDNGIGFDTDAPFAPAAATRRLGLRGIRERVALLGGRVEFESTPGNGTTIFARIPDAAHLPQPPARPPS